MCLLLVCAPASADSDRIAATVRYLSSLGSRVVGYPGCDSAAAFIEAEFRAMQLERIRREQFEIIIPIDKGGRLRVGEVEIPAHGLWPNLVRTPTVAPEGVHAPMIYGGHGDWTDFDGQEVDGRIVLLEFNSEDRWLHAGALGARAVVFIAPEKSTWLQANEKYVGTPLDLPRYWIDRKRGTALRHQLLQQGELPVSLYGRMDWEERPAWNIVGEITGTDPQLKDELVVVQAYYDGISVVPALAPSAEAAAGIAALLELGRHLRDQPPARSVLLLATSAHFHDRLGTRAFFERHARFTYAERVPQPLPVKLFISLDLSSRSDRLGIWHATGISSLRRFYASFGRRFTTYARQIAPGIGLHPDRALANGISPTRGLEWWNFVPAGMMTDARVAFKGGLVSLLFATVFDERFQLDTPLDLPESVDFENLARQTALLLPMLRRGLNDPKLFTDLKRFGAVVKDRLRYDDRGQSPVLRDQLGDLRVEVRGFPRRSQLPDQPIGDALVVFSWGSVGAKPLKGVRALRYLRTAADGNVTFYGLPYGGGDLTVYGLDPISGDVVLAPDLSKRSQVYNQARPGGAVSVGVGPSSTEKTIVTFAAVPRPVYGLIDPNSLLPMRTLEAFDPAGRAARQFGYAIHGSSSDGVGVVFGPRGSDHSDRLKLVVDGGRMLLTKSLGTESEKRARGVGFLLASESLTPQTDLLGLRDMWRLTESRIQTMRRHVIENQRLTRLHERTRHLMAAAEDAGRELRWSDFVANVREATGTEARAYPDALATLNDVIKGMLFFLALVIPAAFFSERLLVAAADIRRQLLGFAVLLLLVWVVISQIHPAFAIANPLVILLAFAIMAMAVFVLAMVFSRFNRYMRDYRTGDAQVHETDISRGGALYSAFMLGISNMRRRKLRTWLTFITLTLLTSTVLSFSSYKDRIHFLGFELSKRGSYAGALIRDIDWKRLELIQHEYVRSHFGGHALLSPRSWYLVEKAEEGGAIVVNSGPKSARANGLLGLSSVESELTRFDDAVVVGTWFERDDESACLLPSRMAEILGIDADQVGTATVAVFGRELLVRGIVDEERVEQLLDLDGENPDAGGLQTANDRRGAPRHELGPGVGSGAGFESRGGFRNAAAPRPSTPGAGALHAFSDAHGVRRQTAIHSRQIPRGSGCAGAGRNLSGAGENQSFRRTGRTRERRNPGLLLHIGRHQGHRGPRKAAHTDGHRCADRFEYHAGSGPRAQSRDPHLLLRRARARPHCRALHRRGVCVRRAGDNCWLYPGTRSGQVARGRRSRCGNYPQLLFPGRRCIGTDGDGRRSTFHFLSGPHRGPGRSSGCDSSLAPAAARGRPLEFPVPVYGEQSRGRRVVRIPLQLLQGLQRRVAGDILYRQDAHRSGRA